MNELEIIISQIEECKAKMKTSPRDVNDILVSLGGKPICITDDVDIMNGEGSLYDEVLLYITLLMVRRLCNAGLDPQRS